MSDAQEGPKTGKVSSTAGIAAFLLLSVAVIGLAYIAYLKTRDLDLKDLSFGEIIRGRFLSAEAETGKKEVYRFTYDPKEHPAFVMDGGLLVKCSRGLVKCLDRKGSEQWSVQVSVENPIARASGQSLLVADQGGKEIYVIDGGRVKWEKKLNNNIINIDISETGYVSVIHESEGYKGAVSVLDYRGNILFTRFIGENYPIVAKVSPSGKTVALASVDTSGVESNTSLEYTDMSGKPFAKVTVNNMIIPSMWFVDDESLICAGNSALMCFDKSMRKKWEQDFNEGDITGAAYILGRYVAVAAQGEGSNGIFNGADGNTAIKVFGINGKQMSSASVQGRVKRMESYSDRIAVYTGRTVYFTDLRGRIVGSFSSQSEIIKVFFYDKQEAAVITKSEVIAASVGGNGSR